jgi:hypothetical protein
MDKDRRRAPRFTTNQPVTVKWLAGSDAADSGAPGMTLDTDRSVAHNPAHDMKNDRLLAATVVDASERGLRLTMQSPLPLDSAVRIDLQNELLLGEVCYCQQSPQGYVVGVELQQSLSNLNDLSNLARAIFGSEEKSAAKEADQPV